MSLVREVPMRIEATHSDGFTEHGLRWALTVEEGWALLEARWYDCPAPVLADFAFDEGPLRPLLPALARLDGRYEARWEDLETRVLAVVDGERSIRLQVYGAGIVVATHPEVGAFLAAWQLLEAAVALHLPGKMLR